MPGTTVFLIWSGEWSKAVAEALHDWLPRVIQELNPWMSEIDIAKGAEWRSELRRRLHQSNLGIICLTPENVTERWVNFEAGALWKGFEESRVCSYLFRLKSGEVQEPLAQFQLTEAVREDTRKLLHTLNKALGEKAIKDEILDATFDMMWPQLEEKLSKIPEKHVITKRRPDDILEEILDLVRVQSRISTRTTTTSSEQQRRYSEREGYLHYTATSYTPPPPEPEPSPGTNKKQSVNLRSEGQDPSND